MDFNTQLNCCRFPLSKGKQEEKIQEHREQGLHIFQSNFCFLMLLKNIEEECVCNQIRTWKVFCKISEKEIL